MGLRNTLPPPSGPGGYAFAYPQPFSNVFQSLQRPRSGSGSSATTVSPGIAPSIPAGYGMTKAQVFAHRPSLSQTQTQTPNPSPIFAARRASVTTNATATNAYPSYNRSNRIVPAGSTFPIILDSGVYVARSLVDIPYRLFYVRLQAVGAQASVLPYAALDRQLLWSSGTEMDWFFIVGGLEPYAQMALTFVDPVGGWRFVDARQTTSSYNQVRLKQETPFLELLLRKKIDDACTEWMVPARDLAN